MYATDQLLDNPDFLIQTIQTLKEEREKRRALELENAQKSQIIGELQPKATYYDLVLQNKSTIPITHIAKDYGMSAIKFNELLHELHVQFKLQSVWLLYAEHQDKGYTQSKTHVIDSDRSVMHTQWTQKGRLFLYDLLKKEKEILPIIEREGKEYIKIAK
jgi:phage antirepressor YoqD-like protein